MNSTGSMVLGSPVVRALAELGQTVVRRLASGIWRPSSSPGLLSLFSGPASGVRCLASDFSGLASGVWRPPSSSRSGIALVMVLGVLSVMVIMAVAFAISMRTERVAAGNYADSVRARQLVQVGLARALDDLAVNLGTNGLMSLVGGTNYPPWAVTNSFTLAYTNTSTNAFQLQLLETDRANEATNFVPRALWAAATNVDEIAASNHWVLIESVVQLGTNPPTTNLMGRVKYLILNCSGLLDANFAGGTVIGITRVGSSNPTDIAIGNLGEIGANFLINRGTAVRYETLEELNALADINNKLATNLFVYSRALPGYWNTNSPIGVGTQVNLNSSVGDLILRMSDITNAFAHAGFSQFESGVLYSNLIDYVDSDSIPSNFEYCVESMPMINEVVVSNVTDVGGGNATMDTTIYFELWYPFVIDNAGTFTPQYKATFTDLSGTGFKPTDVAWQSLPPIVTPGKQSFAVRQASSSIGPQPAAIDPIRFRSTIDVRVSTGAVPQDVDRIYSIMLTNENAVGPSISVASTECLDPRFNGDLVQWSYPASPTIERINTACLDYFILYPDLVGETNMYVANMTNLYSVGELGYLAYAPWKTVKLYGSGCHRILDVFGLSTNASDVLMTNTVHLGLVNCNSNLALDATAVVFAGMPVDQYPGEGGNQLSMSAARTFAETIFYQGIITNLSEVGRNLNSTDFPIPTGLTELNELQREAYFRNAFNLINVRQNLFTIIIEAHVASGGNIPRNPVRQRAVALVWRDPYTGEMFVRSIKWLRD